MKEKDFKKYMADVISEINKHKWFESEKRKKDIGFQEAAMDWIPKYANKYREHWERVHKVKIDNNDILYQNKILNINF